ncbi:probable multidrug resistance-associated protein lethal(2)03659 [Coccinella septempunctata]|uniref:probable multidrug resistance-associated protein lethal(2)03659 n=1 Tax=Coccinella septempunctata TaxID=41139 RepID=UPI001D07F052|nr:probable multidrug resistance-associated protein lethal(2)03659 [Coccinella septempunctata]
MFILNCTNIKYHSCQIMRQESFIARPANPQANSNFLSILSFWYTIRIFNKAKRGDLSEEDLTQPLTEHKSSYLGEKLAILWSKEVIKAKETGKKPRLHSVLYKCFLRQIIGFSAAAVVLEMIVRISQPLFLKLLLRYYSSDNLEKLVNQTETSKYTYLSRMIFMYDENQGPISKHEAVFFTCGVILSSWMSIAIGHPYLMGIMHLGMKMRIACCSLIYRKALRIRLEFAGASMMGNIINLLSNDVNRFDNGIMFLPYTWLCPLQIAFVTYFMYMEMGLAGIYGILALISVIPIQLWLAMRVMTLRHQTALRTDERVRETNEMIQAIQVLKMYTWEEVFMKIIYKSRSQEMKLVNQMGYIKGVLMSLIIFSFRFSIFVMTVAYVYTGGAASAEKIFVITAFLLILRQTVTIYYPQTLAQGAELMVSLQRLEEFLRLPESSVGDPTPLKPKFLEEMDDQQLESRRVSSFPEYGVLRTSGASVKINDEVILRDITFEVDPGVLTVVIGPVGSGKSCLLHLLLGELSYFEGTVEVKGVISYASQEPWLFSGTIRQNILFGRKFERRRYEEVCFACALNTDFKLLPQGDKTPVGEKGTSLSGGQRARVNLARAIYKEADIYLLDDPLSAVDTHVGQHLFEECVCGYLSDKIVVLVTHQLQYLENVDQIILMKDGVIETKADYDHMKDAGLDFSLLMIEQLTMTDDRIERPLKGKKSTLLKIVADISRRSIATATFIDKENQMPAIKKLSKEAHKTGGVGSAVYKEYMKAASNSFGIFLMFFLFFSTQIVASSADYYLSMWINQEEEQLKVGEVSLTTRKTYIYVYSCIIIVCIVIALLRSIHFFTLCTRASLNLHNNMFRGVVETRMSFFYSHNSGEILNTFSKDLGSIDEVLPNALIDTMQIFLNLFGVILVVGIINPYLLIPTVLILIIFHFMRNFYLKISNNIKRLEDVTKSPVFAHINSTLQGITTIRSNGAEQILTSEFDKHQDIHSSAWFTYIATARAFGYWLDLICIVYIAIVSFSFLFMSNQGSFVGLAITQTISLTGLFQWGLRQSVEVENQMVSVDRVLDYVKLEPEPNLKSSPAEPPPPHWPTTGKIEYSHAFMTYGPQGAHVLRDVNFVIQDKEKIGIVGRTGAGKSSLIATLFRLAYFYGEVRIDNLDISQLSLHDLRRKISIIPQEPVLFNGTLQYNLDPFSEFDTNWIMKVLIDLENKDALSHGKDCLNHMIIEGGVNVSIGQRQIICLARALLKNNRIIVMDEATANIDAKTDKFIQSIIRTKFSNCTVLTIAHRLHTIMDSDKVLVMDAGQVAEFDHPHILLQDPEGIFSGMVEKTGKHMAENLRKIAKQTFEAQTKTE